MTVRVFGMLLISAFMVLALRLIDLQLLRHEELRGEAELNTHKQYYRQPCRGDIVDTKGIILASSTPVKTVSADPRMMFGKEAELARQQYMLRNATPFKTFQSVGALPPCKPARTTAVLGAFPSGCSPIGGVSMSGRMFRWFAASSATCLKTGAAVLPP